jgi:prepilin-type N-terminal cleavage/methylation domain-containing protein
MRTLRPSRQRGFTVLELLVTLGLFGLLCLVAVSNIKVLENPLVSASANLTHYFRLVRVRAIAQTRSIIVTPTSNHTFTAAAASSCTSATTTPVSDLALDIGNNVSITPINWTLCFTQRGLVHQATLFTLHSQTGVRTIEVALGGGVEIQ